MQVDSHIREESPTKRLPYEERLLENGEALEEIYDNLGGGRLARHKRCKMMWITKWKEFGEVVK